MSASAMLCFASPAFTVCSLCPADVLSDGARQGYQCIAAEMGSLAVSQECCSLHIQARQSPQSQHGCQGGKGRYLAEVCHSWSELTVALQKWKKYRSTRERVLSTFKSLMKESLARWAALRLMTLHLPRSDADCTCALPMCSHARPSPC